MASTNTISICSSSSDPVDACLTPQTITTNHPDDDPQLHPLLPLHLSPPPEYFPQADKIFLIRTHDQRALVLELHEGTLRAVEQHRAGLGIAWRCVKRLNWYGFVNTVSGTYLGHNGEGAYQAMMKHHKGPEWFVVERHADGGYVLLGPGPGEKWGWLHQVAAAGHGKGLVAVKEGGTAWDFVELDVTGVSYKFARDAV